MRLITSIFFVLGVFNRYLVSGAAIETSKQVLHVGEHTISVATIPVSESRLASITNTTGRSPTPETTLTKRATTNCCVFGTIPFCVNGLSDSPDPPTLDDCTALTNALRQLSQQIAQTSAPPCNVVGNFNCPNFVVSPGFEQTFSLGTCLVGFINLNAPGGNDESMCDFLMAGSILSDYNGCITPGNSTGVISVNASPNQPGAQFGKELRHV